MSGKEHYDNERRKIQAGGNKKETGTFVLGSRHWCKDWY